MSSKDNTGLFLGIAAAAAIGYFAFIKPQQTKEMTQTVNGVKVDPRLAAVPGWNTLDPATQAQIAAVVNNGTKAQLLLAADQLQAGAPQLAGVLRTIAQEKA